MQNNIQDIDKLSKATQLIAKHPISFVAAVFFCMFWATYYINIRKNEDNEETWKELYIKEKENCESWAYNVKKVAFGGFWDKIIYALGANAGALLGLWVSKQIF